MGLRKRVFVVAFVVGAVFSGVALALAHGGGYEAAGGAVTDVKAPIAPPPGVDANKGFDRDSDGPGPVPLPVGDPHATPTDESDEVAGPPNHISDQAVAPEILAYCRDTISAREAAQTVTNGDADQADQAFICKMIIAKAEGDLPPGDYTDAQLADSMNRADTGSEASGR